MYPGCPEDEAEDIVDHAFEVGSGRVGRTSDLDLVDKIRLAVVAHVRHTHTDYDELLQEIYDREYAREVTAGAIAAKLKTWEEP
jgi:hypothetical protein